MSAGMVGEVMEAIRVGRYRLRIICSGMMEIEPIHNKCEPFQSWLWHWTFIDRKTQRYV